ncbi:MAG: hypothetical protein RIT25_192 [Planctomycetota bacterium]
MSQTADPNPSTLSGLLARSARQHGGRVFLPRRSARGGDPVTFRDLDEQAALVSAALHAFGIGHGDRVGLLAENRCEWLLADLGIAGLGAVDVPRGGDTTPVEMAFLMRHSGCRAAFVEDDKVAEALLARRAEMPELRLLFSLSHETRVAGVLPWPEMLEHGRRAMAAEPELVARLRARVQPQDLLTIVYTSGTTADPKGVMLTHANVTSNVANTLAVLRFDEHDSFLSVLPAWHMYERLMDYLAMSIGAQLVYTDRRRIKEDLRAVSPTVFAAVPRIWEMLHDGIVDAAHKQPGWRGALLRGVLSLARAIGARRAGPVQRALHHLACATVHKKVHAMLGGRLRVAVSGGGSLPRHVDECLLGLGIPILNGYGLTETSPVASVRRAEANGPGHIGLPIPHTRIVARDPQGRELPPGQTGVLWIHGPQVMQGYYANPTKTAEALDAQHWFCSGDLGHVDADGTVWITGRAKDTIVLAGGENVEPERVEAVLKTSPLVEQAVVVGQDQKSLGVLLVPRFELLETRVARGEWDVSDGVLTGRRVRELFRAELDRLVTRENGCRSCEHIGPFRVLDQALTVENGMLTQTLKVKRHEVQKRLAAILQSMFD